MSEQHYTCRPKHCPFPHAAMEEESLQEQAQVFPNLKGRAGNGEKGKKDKETKPLVIIC